MIADFQAHDDLLPFDLPEFDHENFTHFATLFFTISVYTATGTGNILGK
jgi:hypothetical protein